MSDSATALHPAAAAPAPARGQAVRDLFAGIAHRYDLVNHVASAGLDLLWRRRAARALGLPPGAWCLDACSGTGDLALAIARGGARVLAVDFCRPMLTRGRAKRCAGLGVTAPVFVEGDALRLPARTGAMDAACVAFGLRNLSDPQAGLAELTRVVRPGGRVAVLEFSRPRHALLRRPYEFYSAHVLPRLGDLLTGRHGTYRYLPQTISTWHSPDALSEAMMRAGLCDVSCRLLNFGIVALHVGTVPMAGPTR